MSVAYVLGVDRMKNNAIAYVIANKSLIVAQYTECNQRLKPVQILPLNKTYCAITRRSFSMSVGINLRICARSSRINFLADINHLIENSNVVYITRDVSRNT